MNELKAQNASCCVSERKKQKQNTNEPGQLPDRAREDGKRNNETKHKTELMKMVCPKDRTLDRYAPTLLLPNRK